MIKLITPPGMLLTTALLAIYAAYAWSIGSIEKSSPLLAGAAISVVACYGAAMVRPWSRYLVYLLTAGFITKLGDSILEAIRAGFFSFQFGSAREIAGSLVPSFAMVLVSLGCCVIAYRQFRPRAQAVESTAATEPTTDSPLQD